MAIPMFVGMKRRQTNRAESSMGCAISQEKRAESPMTHLGKCVISQTKRAESPGLRIAQGKRSDTLGEPLAKLFTLWKSKSVPNEICFNAFDLVWRKRHATFRPECSCVGNRQSRVTLGYA